MNLSQQGSRCTDLRNISFKAIFLIPDLQKNRIHVSKYYTSSVNNPFELNFLKKNQMLRLPTEFYNCASFINKFTISMVDIIRNHLL